MECNKEEAIRAKQLAEKKMEIKDFSGALKIALKAQSLDPALENISQLILVCDVHCSAEKQSFGTDKDWYGILKVDPSADDISIKKQYRKLALVLHPDKNSFSGSTDAFKLIGEAQRVLLDREKRLIHDSKRRAFGKISKAKQPSSQANGSKYSWNQVHAVNLNRGSSGNSGNFQRAQFNGSGHSSSFWTICPLCSVRYQFFRDVLNKSITCQNCKESFTAYELTGQTQNHTRPHVNRVSPKPAQGPTNHTFTTKPMFEKKEPVKTQGNVNRKRKKKTEDSESSDSDESSEPEEDANQNVDVRRSVRSKRNVSYKENMNDNDNGDDGVTPSKHAKKEANKAESVKVETKGGESVNVDDGDDDDDIEEEIEAEVFQCPDPDFSDFDSYRKEESFKVGQLWACYDTEDAMPRFYAFIKKISPGFKMQIMWLKPDPVTADEKKWVKEDLPVSCGRYKHEKLDKSQDLFSFSHLMTWEAGQKAKTVTVIPRKGETWALFKNWSMNMYTLYEDAEERKFEYEPVEVLTDFDEKKGVRVAHLEKVKGFVCLFRRKAGAEMEIAGSEKYRFAHMVPCCRMSGDERDGVPKGSFELDPAALPASVFE
ncbi:uncharacterized protein LOC143598216 [Bidens hawaiensis]|uniref:uncharacterized protein LOC143598216 n=1 Tax=Bidens hawaiensis TaxID=980011 RepID=UPI00404A1A0A